MAINSLSPAWGSKTRKFSYTSSICRQASFNSARSGLICVCSKLRLGAVISASSSVTKARASMRSKPRPAISTTTTGVFLRVASSNSIRHHGR
eukprot:2677353-Prymnesium_polylepis.1